MDSPSPWHSMHVTSVYSPLPVDSPHQQPEITSNAQLCVFHNYSVVVTITRVSHCNFWGCIQAFKYEKRKF